VANLDSAYGTPALCLLPLLVAVRVDVDLGRWAQELKNMQETGNCLSQPACQPDLPPQLRSSLYIRRSYRKLYDLLWHKCKGGEAGKQRGFVVTGTPGIGKSAFALYLIQQLGRKGQIVFYKHQDDSSGQSVWLKFDFRDPDHVVAKRTLLSLPIPDGEHTWLHMGVNKCCAVMCSVTLLHSLAYLTFSVTTCVSALVCHPAFGPFAPSITLVCCRFAGDMRSNLAWLIIEGPPPKLEFAGNTKTVVLSSPNYGNFHTWLKGK
jgi:hypothetical protein